MKNPVKILFLLKKRSNYGPSFGLSCSCNFVKNALEKLGIESKIVEIIDGNGADKEIYEYKPTHIIFEAIFMTSGKINELINLYNKRGRDIQWFVRIHSDAAFISREGIAVSWLKEYWELSKKHCNFNISCNSKRIKEELELTLGIKSLYLPNIYCPPTYDSCSTYEKYDNYLDIACMGATRELKAIFPQALAAMIYANKTGRILRFHINCNRIEEKNDAILKNIKNLFKDSGHKLITWDWLSHENFNDLVSIMDLGMQVSFSETFSIISGDFIWNNIPLVGSKEIKFILPCFKADPTNYKSMVRCLFLAEVSSWFGFTWINKLLLRWSNFKAENAWLKVLQNTACVR